MKDPILEIATLQNVVICGAETGLPPRIAIAFDRDANRPEFSETITHMFSGLFLMYAGLHKKSGRTEAECLKDFTDQITAATKSAYHHSHYANAAVIH